MGSKGAGVIVRRGGGRGPLIEPVERQERDRSCF